MLALAKRLSFVRYCYNGPKQERELFYTGYFDIKVDHNSQLIAFMAYIIFEELI